MKVLLFGATGMVGQGVLRECLSSSDVSSVTAVGRTATGVTHPKLGEIVHRDLTNYAAIESQLAPFDACFFCLGISSVGLAEAQYTAITYDITMAAAQTLARLNPAMTFIFVSGAGTDSTEKGSSMWARIKGRTENALLRLPFKAAYMFRPGIIQPRYGAKSKTTLYRAIYTIAAPLFGILRSAFPSYVLATDEIGQAMLIVSKHGWPQSILEAKDIRAVLAKTA